MGCRTTIAYLDAYADGELGPWQRRRVEAHLAGCAACRQRLEALRDVEGLLAAASPVPPVPAGLSARIMAEARQRQAAAEARPRVSLASLRAVMAQLSMSMRLAVGATALLALVTGVGVSDPGLVLRQGAGVGQNDINGLEWFAPVSPASVGAAYLAMAEETKNENQQ